MSFELYYQKYLTFHKKLGTKILHAVGNVATLGFIISIFAYNMSLWWLIFSPFIIYFFAWPSHWWIEKNKPAAFKNPIYAKIADWRMMVDLIRGKV